jgi:uncharacterized OB-fold protein
VSEHAGKHFPRPTAETRPYWDGCRQGLLLLQRCGGCGAHQFYPRMMCTRCDSDAMEWVPASGHGRIRSFTVVRRPVSKAYAAQTPYIVALIELAEGPTMMSNVVECTPGDAAIGLPVEVVFERWSEEISVPMFRPRRE